MDPKKLKTVLYAAILTFGLGSCMEKDLYQGSKDEEKEFNDFSYSTVNTKINLEVSYLNCGVEANVYFELYDEMPVTVGEYNYIKRDGVLPFFTAYTADNSIFKGEVELPAYVKKVYIYSPAFFAKTLIEAEVVNGSIKATDDSGETTTRVSSGTGESYMLAANVPDEYKGTRWKSWLGSYNKDSNGEIEYQYFGDLAAKESDNLYTAHTSVINVNKSCPDEYRSYSDMYIDKDAEVAVTFLGQNTCWNCSMGYYYYKEGHKPSSLEGANIIMLFPNTQDGQWSNNISAAQPTAGIDRLTTAQLIYYPNIASGSKEGATNTFPAGYRIGFALANNAWSNRISNFKSRNNKYRAATSEGLSIDNQGIAFSGPRTAAYKFGDWVMISFEDFTTDENFSDVVITLKSNPVDAITDIPTVNPDDNKTTAETLKGIYAFEDLWPSQGDYDLNDVVVRYTYGKTFDIDNKIYTESFTFRPFQNVASNNNGLAFKLIGSGSIASATCSIRKAGEEQFTEIPLQYEEADNVYVLTNNVKDNMKGDYKITINYNSFITKQSEIQPFIFKNEEGGKRWEVHIAKEKPTSKMNTSHFGEGQDASVPENGIYYVRKGLYPFAIFLSGANEKDISKILDAENERVAIDQLYSSYKGWVESGGTTNQDWYKK